MTEQNLDALNSEQIIADAASMLNVETKEVHEPEVEVPQGHDGQVQESQDPRLEPEAETREGSEDDLSHGEKSRLGRKVKRIEDKFGNELSNIRAALESLIEGQRKQPQPSREEAIDEEEEMPEYPTAADIKRFVAKQKDRLKAEVKQEIDSREQGIKNQRINYSKEYGKLVLENVDKDETPELYELLTDTTKVTEFNTAWSNFSNPYADFAKNLAAATKHILAVKKDAGKPNVHGKPSAVPVGVNVPNVKPKVVSAFDLSKLSKDERAIAEMLTEDERKQVFGR